MSEYSLFDDSFAEDIELSYWFDSWFVLLDVAYPNFQNIVESAFIYSQNQDDRRKYGFSEVYYGDRPTVYHAGDVVNLPYKDTETSTMEAMGLAWAADVNGIPPA